MRGTIIRIFGRRKAQTAAVAMLAAISSVGLLPRDAYVASAAKIEPAAETKPLSSKPTTASTRTSARPRTVVERLTSNTRATNGLPNIEHPRVQTWITRFTTTQRGSFNTYLRRMTRYETMISKKLADRGMPQGLIYLAMIESGFNPRAKSPVKASGLWQFMSATGREYGLTVNRRVDERNNPVRSTDAALRYLDRLYDRFGSWYLAAAAYNTGQGRVSKVLKQVTGKTRGTDADFYRIAHRLPQETRDYVPKMIAAARIGTNPERYGFSGD